MRSPGSTPVRAGPVARTFAASSPTRDVRNGCGGVRDDGTASADPERADPRDEEGGSRFLECGDCADDDTMIRRRAAREGAAARRRRVSSSTRSA